MNELEKIAEELETVEFDCPEREGSAFMIVSDAEAGWALRKIAKIKSNEKRMLDQINERIEAYTNTMQFKAEQIQQAAKRESEYFEHLLLSYFNSIPDELKQTTKAGRISYSLPEGKIMTTAPKQEYKYDKNKLLSTLKDNVILEYVRIKEEPDWAVIKKKIIKGEDGKVYIVTALGECIETNAITIEDVPKKFEIKMEEI